MRHIFRLRKAFRLRERQPYTFLRLFTYKTEAIVMAGFLIAPVATVLIIVLLSRFLR